jgi:hypothetical protein
MRFMGRAATLVALLGGVPAVAVAQTPAATATGSPATAPADSAAADPPRPVVPATGYGWTDPKKKAGPSPSKVRVSHHVKDAPDATMPGFETLADGSSRLFVELSKPVQYETKTGKGTITYVLKGAQVNRRNNYNPLVTVHFNTPISTARLVPHGSDLWFVVVLRAKTQPTVALDATKDGGAMLRIEFPKGDYLPATHAVEPSTGDSAAVDTHAGH